MVKCIIFDFYNVLYPYSEAAESTIKQLEAEGYTLGAISSLSPDKVAEIAEHYRIDLVLSAQEYGLSKADEKIYKLFLEKFNFSAQDCLIIDDQQSRLVAAKSAGLQTVWLSLKDELLLKWTDRVIENIQEVTKIISQ